MEQRLLGKSGLSVSVLSFGTMTIGGRDRFQHMGNLGVAETSRMLDICSEAGVTVIDTADMYSFGGAEEILGEALQGKRQQFVDRHQSVHACRQGRARYRSFTQAHPRELRGQPAAAAHRLSRRLHVPRARPVRAGRGDAARVRRSGQPGEGPLHRLLQPLGVACHEGARRLGPPLVPALHRAAGQLLAAGARRRARDGADGPRSGRRDDGVEPAAFRAARRGSSGATRGRRKRGSISSMRRARSISSGSTGSSTC